MQYSNRNRFIFNFTLTNGSVRYVIYCAYVSCWSGNAWCNVSTYCGTNTSDTLSIYKYGVTHSGGPSFPPTDWLNITPTLKNDVNSYWGPGTWENYFVGGTYTFEHWNEAAGTSSVMDARWDKFIIRKYTFPEPTTSIWGEKIVGWVNDTWIAFTPAMCTEPYKECWSNVTKIVDLAVGARIAWCVYVNDTSNNWNATSCENPFSYITTGVNVITINLNATKVWWNDSLIASGVAKYANGASVNGSVLLSVDNTNYSCSQTDANGNWNCTFNAPIRIGVHTLTVKITDNSGYTFQNSTFLTVSPYYGRKPIGSIPRIVYELPMLIQDLDGEIKRVLARIIVWKD